ncbi:MAG TPA: hypothetical protein VM686_23265 [Polyangiaceae bacterium]|nr:hypothetical protein [Polyangiaceae bacterium]
MSAPPPCRWLFLAACLVVACDRGDGAKVVASAGPSASVAAPPPVDRLAPGELAPGTRQVFGLVIPEQMSVVTQSPTRALLEGEVEAGELVDYVRSRVVVAHVEIGAGRTIFPQARIKDGPPDRLYQLEVMPVRRGTTMTVEDVTPRPKDLQNVPQDERWRRAGRRPDGSVDPNLLK